MPVAASLYYFSHLEEEYLRPPTVLIHGAGGSYLYWPPEIRRLAGQRIFAPDLPGHGKSDGVGRQSIDDYAQCILDFLDALHIHKAILIGHSMGAAVALTLALEHFRRVLGLGLVGGGARMKVSPDLIQNSSSPATLPFALQSIAEMAFSPVIEPHLKQLAMQRMSATRSTVINGDFIACNQFDVMDRLAKIRVPTLVVCGADDRMTPPRYSEHLASSIKRAELVIVPEAGHMVMIERPKAVASALVSFIKEISYRPGE
jgi:pimeloyl-ACP methyl ester carboxylesterase